MNRFKSLITLFGAAAVAALSTPAASAIENVILTVQVDKALDSYYKVNNFRSEIQQTEEQAMSAASQIEEQRNALVQEFEDLREQANSDILTEEARREATQDAQQKMQEIQEKENELRKFISDTQRQFNARRQQQINLFYSEIADVVQEISTERGATLVIDVSARAGDGRATVLYSADEYDITPEDIERNNATPGQEDAGDAAAPAAE